MNKQGTISALGNISAVFRFEWKRSLTTSRILWWLVLAVFPSGIMALTNLSSQPPPIELVATILCLLVPMVICMLGVFLWCTPAVSAELERESWVYLAVRPKGGTAVLLGKYLVAVTWTIPAAIIGLSAALLIVPTDESAAPFAQRQQRQLRQIQKPQADQPDEQPVEKMTKLKLFQILVPLCFLSTICYGAVYTLIGVVFTRRSMIVAVVYTLLFEVVVGLIPAVVNQFTIQFRLRSLFIDWAGMALVGRAGRGLQNELYSQAPPWQHVVILSFFTVGLLTLAVVILRQREFASGGNGE